MLINTSENSAQGHGHAAVLIGSDKDGWTYFSFSPKNSLDAFNAWLFGQVDPDPQTLGVKYKVGVTLAQLKTGQIDHKLSQYNKYVHYKASAQDDLKAIQEATKWKDKKYTLESNCLSMSASALGAAGVKLIISPVGDAHSKNTKMYKQIQDILTALNRGQGPLVKKIPNFDLVPSPVNTYYLTITSLFAAALKATPGELSKLRIVAFGQFFTPGVKLPWLGR